MRLLFGIGLLWLSAGVVHGQSITVAPTVSMSVTPVPLDQPWWLFALVIALAGAAWLSRRSGAHRFVWFAALATTIVFSAAWKSPELYAQLTTSFTNPAGETRALPVLQITDSGTITSFEAADFTNDSGVSLTVKAIESPSLNQCFPQGFTNLAAEFPPITPPLTPCSIGSTIAPNASCRVDIAAMCREEADQASLYAAANPTSLTAASNTLVLEPNDSGEVTITNSGAAAAINVHPVIPSASGLTIASSTCGASLLPQASCVITLTAHAAEGPTMVSVSGSNTQPVIVEVTVAAPATTLAIDTAPVSFDTNGSAMVTISNSGAEPALNITATFPNGSSITVANTTCATPLLSGNSCAITLAATAAEGPTTVSFSGSNTQPVTVDVTVTIPVTTLDIDNAPVSFDTNGSSVVTITNSGEDPAFGIKASVPAGSSITVSNTTCAVPLLSGNSCAITLAATTAEGPTTVSFSGSNTQPVTLEVTVTQDTNQDIDIGTYQIMGTCGVLGVLSPGFTLTASATAPLPAGTTIIVNGSGVANIGIFSASGGAANVAVLNSTSRLITLMSELPAGTTIAFRTTLSITVAFALNGTVTLPTGFVATGSKPSGSVSSTSILCSAN